MKRSLQLIIFLCLNTIAGAQQNYVPNGNFEDYAGCPSDYSQINLATGWRRYTTGGTPDYFNVCATNWHVAAPANYFGYQQPASGNGYVGFYCVNVNGEYKEYIARDITPLTKGGEYEVSMSVSLADSTLHGVSDLGIHFYNSGPYTINQYTSLTLIPTIIYTEFGIITEKNNWVRLTKTFVADSAYDKIIIGSFLDSNSFINGSQPSPPYFYVDSVVVRLLDTVKVEYTDGILCAGDAIQVKYWTRLLSPANNVVTIQLSDANGSFANPVEIGSKQSNKSGLMVCN
ncbi:MAG: hypothetical protein KDC07_02295, partial [Chitinophagaceae bacterium]|nr:hypothetical protein [Chitinophagaceae bacterium]